MWEFSTRGRTIFSDMLSIYSSLKNKSHILVTAERIAETLLLGMAFYYLEMGIEIDSSILRSIYFSKAGIVFCTLIILIRKPPIFKIWNILYGLVGVLAPFLYLKFAGYTRENSGFALNFMYYRGVEQFMFVWLLLDSIRLRKELKEQKYRWWYIVLFAIAVSLMCIFESFRLYPLIIPTTALFLTPIKKEKWLELMNSMAVAYYFIFLLIVTGSLIENPTKMWEGRYIGSFSNLATEGEFTAMAFFVMFYLVLGQLKKNGKEKLWALVPGVLGVIPIVYMTYIESRAAQLSVILVVFVTVFVYCLRKNVWLSMGALLLALSVCVAGILLIKHYSVEFAQNMIANGLKENEVRYWYYRIAKLGGYEPLESNFKEGTIGYLINGFSSNRLDIWAEYAKDFSLWGSDITSMKIPSGWVSPSPHNFFVFWLHRLGLVFGSIVCVCYLATNAFAINKHMKSKADLMTSIFYIGGFAFIFLTTGFDAQLWVYIILALQYPMMVCLKEGDKGNGCEN